MAVHTSEMSSFRQQVRELIRRMADEAQWYCCADELSKDAQTRAIQLLKQQLTPAQREQYDKRHHFYVTGGDTGRLYRIRHGVQMNVERLDRMGRRIHVLCFMPEGGLAIGDVMLAQKIALELFETETLQIANKIAPFLDWDNTASARAAHARLSASEAQAAQRRSSTNRSFFFAQTGPA